MSFQTDAFEKKAQNIIKNLEKRNMEGFYCENTEALISCLLPMIKEGSSISWGGSETVARTGILDLLSKSGKYEMIDRSVAKDLREKREFLAKAILSDVYFMSTNAITEGGELINIDGFGNRVCCLIQGPSEVFVIAGMNKVVKDVDAGIYRTRNVASPANTLRLNLDTPCSHTGSCNDCMSPSCICNQIVITRRSNIPKRIKVFLVGEVLGF